jgi:hypothetical protein
MKGSGGTQGGMLDFIIGLCLAGAAVYFFFDSVRMASADFGWISGMMGGGGGHGRGGFMETTSMGIVFLPFGIGVFSLFVDARQKWAWWITWIGLAVIAIEMLSRIRFLMNMKVSHFMIMLIAFLFGCALIFRSYKESVRAVESARSPESDDA